MSKDTERKPLPGETMLAVRRGKVAGAVVIDSGEIYRETMKEWAADPDVEEMFRVPVEVARKALFKPVSVARALLAESSK